MEATGTQLSMSNCFLEVGDYVVRNNRDQNSGLNKREVPGLSQVTSQSFHGLSKTFLSPLITQREFLLFAA